MFAGRDERHLATPRFLPALGAGVAGWARAVAVAAALGATCSARAPAQTCSPRPVVLGVNVQGQNQFDLARSANLGWLRINLRWSEVNPAPGVWDFSRIDAQVLAARLQGLQILALLSHTPAWLGGGANGTVPPVDVDPWRAYVRAVAERYSGQIAAFEIWNEPDYFDLGDGIGWASDLTERPLFSDYVRVAALEIRRRARGALVVGPALSSGGGARAELLLRQFEAKVYQDGNATDFLDVVSIHQNALRQQTSGEWLAALLTNGLYPLASLAPRLASKPVWITEFGWLSDLVGETRQGAEIERAVELMTGSGDWPACGNIGNFRITQAFVYKLEDSDGETSGLFRADHSPKPVVTEYLREMEFPAVHARQPPAGFRAQCDELECSFAQTAFSAAGPWQCDWDFGDGGHLTGCSVFHRFPHRGAFLVGLDMRLADFALAGRAWQPLECADESAPTVRIVGLRSGRVVRDTIAVRVRATDNRAVERIELLVDGLPWKVSTLVRSLRLDVGRLANGPHQVQALARDGCGNVGTSGIVTIEVRNPR